MQIINVLKWQMPDKQSVSLKDTKRAKSEESQFNIDWDALSFDVDWDTLTAFCDYDFAVGW